MGLQNHTLQIGGTARTLAQWGITSCVVTHAGMGDDSMSFEVPFTGKSKWLCGADTLLTLHSPSGTVVWKGHCVRPTVVVRGGSMRQAYACKGPMWYLDRKVFTQPAKFADASEDYDSGVHDEQLSDVVLCGTGMSNRDQITEVFAQVVDVGAPVAASVGGLPLVTPPLDRQVDRYCGDVIRGIMKWTPEATCRWEYGGGNPRLVFGTGNTFQTHRIALERCEDFQGGPRWDLWFGSYTLVSVTEVTATSAATGDHAAGCKRLWRKLASDVSTSVGAPFGEIINTVEGTGVLYDGRENVGAEDVVIDGMAARLHSSFKEAQCDASWSYRGEEVDWTVKVGQALVFPPDVSLVAGGALIQSIVRDIATGKTSLKAGPPAHLGLNDLNAILRANRVRRPPEGHQTGLQLGYKPRQEATGFHDETIGLCDPATGATRSITVQAR